jgi:hypothetical protein
MSKTPDASNSTRQPARRIIQGDGVQWVVMEIPSTFDRRSSHLVFESEHVMRRVRDFPADWQSLNDRDLYALSERPLGKKQ